MLCQCHSCRENEAAFQNGDNEQIVLSPLGDFLRQSVIALCQRFCIEQCRDIAVTNEGQCYDLSNS